LLIERGEEAVNLRTLRGAKGVKWYVDCELNKEKVKKEVEEEALLPGWYVKCNVYCILYR